MTESESLIGKTLSHYRITEKLGGGLVSPALPMAQLNLARAYASQGDATKARAAYQDFFAVWKTADPDIPVLQQAKTEYAKLP